MKQKSEPLDNELELYNTILKGILKNHSAAKVLSPIYCQLFCLWKIKIC